jgi:hypothetical protein
MAATTRILLAVCALMVLLAPLSAPSRVRGAEREDIAVIVHPSVPVSRMGAVALEAVFTRSTTAWADGVRIVPFNLEPGNRVRVDFDRAVLRMDPDLAARFWIEHRIRGQGTAPPTAPTEDMMVRVVAKLRGSIGYAPASIVGPGVRVVALIRAGEVVAP